MVVHVLREPNTLPPVPQAVRRVRRCSMLGGARQFLSDLPVWHNSVNHCVQCVTVVRAELTKHTTADEDFT